jgi:hypothetical protein
VGQADVAIAFLLAIFSFAVLALAPGRIDELIERKTYRAFRILIHGIMAMLVVFVFYRDHIVWRIARRGWPGEAGFCHIVCLPGLMRWAWRIMQARLYDSAETWNVIKAGELGKTLWAVRSRICELIVAGRDSGGEAKDRPLVHKNRRVCCAQNCEATLGVFRK